MTQKILNIDLSKERINEEYHLKGKNIKVISATSDCYIQFEELSNDPINLAMIDEIKLNFSKFYLSNKVQVGCYINCVIGSCDFQLITNIARPQHMPLELPQQNIPPHLIGRVLDRPPAINTWNIDNPIFRHSLDITSQTTRYGGLYFSIDGRKMYIAGRVVQQMMEGKIFEYDLNTPWDISTATFRHSLNTSTQTRHPFSLLFNPIGTLMFTINRTHNQILKYTLSEKWNIATATHTTTIPSPFGNLVCFHISSTGHKMYLLDITNDYIKEYDLNVPWDISTATFRHSLNIAAQTTTPLSLFLSPDGLRAYIVTHQLNKVFEYRLIEAWNISTGIYKKSFNFDGILVNPAGIFINPEGRKMYIGSTTTDHIYEFDL